MCSHEGAGTQNDSTAYPGTVISDNYASKVLSIVPTPHTEALVLLTGLPQFHGKDLGLLSKNHAARSIVGPFLEFPELKVNKKQRQGM